LWAVYHEGEAGDGGPGVGEGGAGELELAEVAGEHDRGQGDAVVGEVAQDHGHREQHLPLGFLQVQRPLPPSEPPRDGAISSSSSSSSFSVFFMSSGLKHGRGTV